MLNLLGYLFMAAPFVIAVLLGVFGPLGIFVLYRFTRRLTNTTKLAAMFWVISIGAVLQIVLSTRILDLERLENSQIRLSIDDFSSGFWASRLFTLLLLGVSLAEILRSWLESRGRRERDPASGIIVAFFAYAVGLTTFGIIGPTEPGFSYKTLYVPIALLGAYHLAANVEIERLAQHIKLALLLPVVGSLVAAVVAPDFAVFRPYQGIPGLNFRLYGVATHANSLGPIALLLLLFELYYPSVSWLRAIGLSCGFVVLVLAQSKTAWIAAVGLAVFVFLPSLARSQMSQTRTALISMVVLVIAVCIGTIMFFAMDSEALVRTLDLETLTGRVDIWSVTLKEFERNPLFGYGPGLWGIEYRYKINMMHVGQAHNQFIHTLGKSGAMGLLFLLGYIGVLLRYAVKYFHESRGLVLALVLFILFRCITEAPFENGVILEWAFFAHALVVVLATHYARARKKTSAVPAAAKPLYPQRGIQYVHR